MRIDTLVFAGVVVFVLVAVIVWAIRHPGDDRPWRGRYNWSNGNLGMPGQYVTGGHGDHDGGGLNNDIGGGGDSGGGGGGDGGGGS